MVVLVQTVMESGNIVNVMDFVEIVSTVGFTVSTTALASVEKSHSSVESIEGSLIETVGSSLLVLSESSSNEFSTSLHSTLLEEHRSASSELRW